MATLSEFSTPSATEIKVARSFAADLDTVWAAWTQARHLKRWWAPGDLTTPVCEVDFRPGGSWFYCMQDPQGNRYCGKMIYEAIDAPRRFSAIDVFVDEDGAARDELPQAHTTIEFEKVAGETIVTNLTRYDTKKARDTVIEMGVEAGLKSCFAKLDSYLAALD